MSDNFQQPTPSPGGEVSQILSVVMEKMDKQQELMLNLIQQQNNQGQSRQEMLQEMMLLKQLFDNGSQNQVDPMQQMRNTMDVMREMGVTINGKAEEKEEGFGDLIEKMTPLIGAAMNQPETTQQKSDPDMLKKMKLKAGLHTLMVAASKNSERITYAEMLLDQLPPETIAQYIAAPDAFEKLIKLEPKVAQHREWFLDLAEHLRAQIGQPSKYSDMYENFDNDPDDVINSPETDQGEIIDGTDNL